MLTFAVLLLFVGMFIVTHGVFEERLRNMQQQTRVEYRFIPRTYLEEQHSGSDLTGMFKNMFEGSTPWLSARGNDARP